MIDIAGEPGIGKSRLLHEFRQRVGKSGAFILSGGCSPEDRQTPFLPFIELVRGSFRVAAGEDQAAVARKLDDGLKVLGLESAQNLGLLLNLLGLKTPEGSLQRLGRRVDWIPDPRSAPAAVTGPLSVVAGDYGDRGSALDRQRLGEAFV